LVSGLLSGDPAQVFFKLENTQKTGSFKIRGAANKLLSLSPEEADAGIVAASNGNHGRGVAAAAQELGISADVFVSTLVSSHRVKLIEEYGARVHRAGSNPLAAEQAARAAAAASGRVFISPYNDLEVIAGQGTIAVELENQVSNADAVFVSVGGGGLISGIGSYYKWIRPRTEIVGCWAHNSRVLYESIRAGAVVDFPEQPTLSESTAGGLEPASVTLAISRRVIDSYVLVSEREILSALHHVYSHTGWLIEGSAAVAVAAFLQECRRYYGKTVILVICGGNVSPEILRERPV
jgi:threonine dehydratase